MTGLIVGLVLGFGLGLATRSLWPHLRRKKPAAEREPNFYGHRWPPVEELQRALPDAPTGFAWEIKVSPNSYGDYIMTLAMVDVARGANVADTQVNLTQYESHGTTWAAFYRSYRIIAREMFRQHIVGKPADWARAQVSRRQAGQTIDYRMET